MTSDEAILERVTAAFASCARPEHFTNYRHCCECFEHDELLRARDLETLAIDDVGSEAWNPVCFTTPEAFAYYLPALARLALAEPDGRFGWYGSQLVFHLQYDGERNARWLRCTPEQRRAVAAFLEHLAVTRAELVDDSMCADELFRALEIWSEAD